ncbi:MAG: prepilin-type N-terminal cleavage/methylation domain-containing protein [Cytophagaceae bacterium]|nr:MAG: prepilin-type N-terminal cleavage/methylation domain-containing protein [Cytophagaceae bacterium]
MSPLLCSSPQRISNPRRAFTLVELIVTISIIALLSSTLLPTFARVQELANKMSCASNIRQINLGIMQYAQDYDDYLPPYYNASNIWLPARLSPYVKSQRVWKCPTSIWEADVWDGTDSDWSVSYGISAHLSGYSSALPLSSITKSAETVLMCENNYNMAGSSVVAPFLPNMGRPYPRHKGTLNVGFVDGHVKSFSLESLQKGELVEDGHSLLGYDASVLWNTF